MGKISTIAVSVCLAGFIGFIGYDTKQHKDHVKETTFTDTATVKTDRLRISAWKGNRYKIWTTEGKTIKYAGTGSTNEDRLENYDVNIEQGTKIEFTGYPDKKNLNIITIALLLIIAGNILMVVETNSTISFFDAEVFNSRALTFSPIAIISGYVLFVFGILGYILSKFKFSLPPIVMGLVLGPIAEEGLRQSRRPRS